MAFDFGRRLNHDPRSREYSFVRRAERGVSVRHAMYARNLDQFYLSACVGFTGAHFLNTVAGSLCRRRYNLLHADAVRPRRLDRYLDNNDGIHNYSKSTERDPFPWVYPPTDDGSSALGLMKWWKDLGVITEYRWTFTFDAFLAALQTQPVLVGTNWYDDMMETDERGIVHSSASGDGGGHEYLANAIDWNRHLIGCENSWGEDVFGKRGTFYLPFALAEELIIHQQGDVAVPSLH
jgi:hypothetical protein